jgi:hypothetical protein
VPGAIASRALNQEKNSGQVVAEKTGISPKKAEKYGKDFYELQTSRQIRLARF